MDNQNTTQTTNTKTSKLRGWKMYAAYGALYAAAIGVGVVAGRALAAALPESRDDNDDGATIVEE